jgi:hypothetical protein
MRLYLITVLILLFCIGVFGQTKATAKWYQFKSDDDGFSIEYPGKPKFESYLDSTQTTAIHRYSFPIGNSLFSVGTFEMQEIAPNMKSQILEAVGLQYIEKIKGKLVSSRKVSRGGCQGKEFTATFSNSYTAVLRTFTSSHKVYSVVYLSTNAKPSKRDIEDFLNSFQIANRCVS